MGDLSGNFFLLCESNELRSSYVRRDGGYYVVEVNSYDLDIFYAGRGGGR